MLGFILAILVIGLVAGFLARALVPGPDPMSIGGTVALGIVGALFGGLVSSLIAGRGFDLAPAGLIGATLGAIAVLLIQRSSGRRKMLR